MNTPLRRARLRSGLTLTDVSKIVGSDPGNLSRIENGKQIPNRMLISKLVQLFRSEDLTELHILYPERFSGNRNHK